jgi:hypothetical protein
MRKMSELLEVDEPTQAVTPDQEDIRIRAYEIFQSDDAGTPEENWYRAESELQEVAGASGTTPARRGSKRAGASSSAS